MVFFVVFGLVFTSFSAFGAVYLDKRFEETLPLTVCGAILIAYICGIFGILEASIWIIYVVAAVLWVFTVAEIIKNKNIRSVIFNLITPASLILAGGMLVYAVCIAGIKVINLDELSHWATCVKIMFEQEGLYSLPQFGEWFPSYPPGISLFQYVLEKIHFYYADWVLYFAHTFFTLTVIMPFFKEARFKDFLKVACGIGFVILALTIFDVMSFTHLLVDELLGVTFAATMGYLFCFDVGEDLYHTIAFSLYVGVLTLLKDSRMLFSAVAVASFVMTFIVENRNVLKKFGLKKYIKVFSPAVAVVFSKVSWSIYLKRINAEIAFAGKYDFVEFIAILFGKEAGYKSEILTKFMDAFFGIYNHLTPAPAIPFGIIFAVLLALLYFAVGRVDNEDRKVKVDIICWLMVATTVIYAVGMLASYMYKFSEYEGSNLASLGRYMNTMAIAIIVLTIIITINNSIKENNGGLKYIIAALFLAISMLNNLTICNILVRGLPNETLTTYNRFAETTELTNNTLEKGSKAAVMNRQANYYRDWLMFRYYVYPVEVSDDIPMTITATDQGYVENDIWTTRNYSPDDLLNNFVKYEYDYLILQDIDEPRFISEYKDAFSDDIVNDHIYKLDKVSGKFALVQ